jgi:hypothetical protein
MQNDSKVSAKTVPLRTDDVFLQAFRAFCNQENAHMADKVREALDATFGSQLAPYIAFFRAQLDHKNEEVFTNENSESANATV